MTERVVTNDNLEAVFEEIVLALDEHKALNLTFKKTGTGKWGMARLWRGWMSTTADFMANNGVTMPLMVQVKSSESREGLSYYIEKAKECIGKGNYIMVGYGSRPFNAEDAHELFTRQHMGADEKGRRLSWAKSINNEDEDKERVATKGERFNALRRHEEWASSRGITLFKPRNSEYQQLINKQEE